MEFGNTPNFKNLSVLLSHISKYINKCKLAFSSCGLCGNTCQQHPLLCQYCEADLPLFKKELLGYDLLQWPAINQLLAPYQFNHLFCLSAYIWPFDTWINQLKYHYRIELAPLLGNLLAAQWQPIESAYLDNDNEKPIVVSIPLHIKKWQQRGFNQAHLIAKIFATNLRYQYVPELLIRRKATSSQVGKTGEERRKNLTQAFEINTTKYCDIAKHVILVDDVVTTGTTANEVCKLLRNAGVQKITLLSVCLALPNKP